MIAGLRNCRLPLPLLAALLLAGCWQSDGSLYRGRQPLEPFRTGRVLGTNAEQKAVEHSRLAKGPGGVYRLTNDDKGSSDFGDSFTVQFFPLAGAPSGILIYEAQEVKKCKPSDNMCDSKPDLTRYHGLVRLRPDGAEIVNPDCKKDSPAAKLPGVKVGDYGTCTFADRATLEQALLALAGQNWKADVVYTFQ